MPNAVGDRAGIDSSASKAGIASLVWQPSSIRNVIPLPRKQSAS
jgi:hypothetical protein